MNFTKILLILFTIFFSNFAMQMQESQKLIEISMTIENDGKLICQNLTNNYIFDHFFWLNLNLNIREFCDLGKYCRSGQDHRLFNQHIFNINQLYTLAKYQRYKNGLQLDIQDDLFTQNILNKTIADIYAFYSYMSRKWYSQKETTGTQTTTDIDTAKEENILAIEPLANLQETATLDNTNIETNVNLIKEENDNIEPPETKLTQPNELEANQIIEQITKTKITKRDRVIQKKVKRKNAEKTQKEKVQIERIIKTDYEQILDLILQSQDTLIFNDKLIQRIKQLDNIQEKENCFYVLLQLLLRNELIDNAFKCISDAPKTPKMAFEYLKLTLKTGLTYENSKKFFVFVLICFNSSLKEETEKILLELGEKQKELIIQLYLAKFEIISQRNATSFFKLFEDAITKNKIDDFIEKALESEIYTELSKWALETNDYQLRQYVQQIVNIFNYTIAFPLIASALINNVIEKVSSKFAPQSEIPKSNSIKTNDNKLLSESHKKWIRYNVKLLHLINQKLNLKPLNKLIIEICAFYGCVNFDDFLIPLKDLLVYLKDYYDSVEPYHSLASHLLNKKNKSAQEFALECYRICADKFNDSKSLFAIYNILDSFMAKEDNKINNRREIVIEQISIARKIIETEATEPAISQFNLAMALLSAKTLGIPVDNAEIIQNLEKSTYPKAKLYYYILYCNEEYENLITIDPNALTQIIINKIANRRSIVSAQENVNNDLYICSLIKSLIKFTNSRFESQSAKSIEAAKKYVKLAGELQKEEQKQLKQEIYNHPLFKMDKINLLFKEIEEAWHKHYPEIPFESYMQDIGLNDELLFFKHMLKYNLKLYDGQTEYDKDDAGDTICHYVVMYHHIELLEFINKDHPGLLNLTNNNGEHPIFNSILSTITVTEKKEQAAIKTIRFYHSIDPEIINLTNNNHSKLTHLAAKFNLLEIFKTLINEFNADFKSIGENLRNAIAIAIEYDNFNIIKYLLEGNLLDDEDLTIIISVSTFLNKIHLLELFPTIISKFVNNKDKLKIIKESFLHSVNHAQLEFVKFFLEKKIIEIEDNTSEGKSLIRMIENSKKSERKAGNKNLTRYDQLISYIEGYYRTIKSLKKKR